MGEWHCFLQDDPGFPTIMEVCTKELIDDEELHSSSALGVHLFGTAGHCPTPPVGDTDWGAI